MRTASKERDAAEALARFFPGGAPSVVAGASGMNNTTRFVTEGGARYVLRVYETHRDAAKVRYEHAVLLALARMPLPFRVPEPVPTPGGDTVVFAGDGKPAALFRYLDGERPTLSSPEALASFGRAAGALSAALADVRVDAEPAYRPYYELDAAHPRCSPDAVARFCEAPPEPFAAQARPLRALGGRLADVRRELPALRGLPHQLVHGDLNASNALTTNRTDISALLDFEFATRDARAMEAAVCVSDLIGDDRGSDDDAIDRVAAFARGYRDTGRWTSAEADALPTLLRLRRLDVFLHFLGRYWDGVDDADVLRAQIESAARTLDRLDRLEGALRERWAASE
ncbi:phosphotransferase [Paenibacillus sp.]|uniref:phosphotransferase n=1 Tax=Paenibacillus sp. TaxID=58172 RepID=UPI002D6B740C|nr:phosphotransferase [Paenibacillus sp.]HZG54992.1 phosphotransferase [Paenibacillus sp.]